MAMITALREPGEEVMYWDNVIEDLVTLKTEADLKRLVEQSDGSAHSAVEVVLTNPPAPGAFPVSPGKVYIETFTIPDKKKKAKAPVMLSEDPDIAFLAGPKRMAPKACPVTKVAVISELKGHHAAKEAKMLEDRVQAVSPFKLAREPGNRPTIYTRKEQAAAEIQKQLDFAMGAKPIVAGLRSPDSTVGGGLSQTQKRILEDLAPKLGEAPVPHSPRRSAEKKKQSMISELKGKQWREATAAHDLHSELFMHHEKKSSPQKQKEEEPEKSSLNLY